MNAALAINATQNQGERIGLFFVFAITVICFLQYSGTEHGCFLNT